MPHNIERGGGVYGGWWFQAGRSDYNEIIHSRENLARKFINVKKNKVIPKVMQILRGGRWREWVDMKNQTV